MNNLKKHPKNHNDDCFRHDPKADEMESWNSSRQLKLKQSRKQVMYEDAMYD